MPIVSYFDAETDLFEIVLSEHVDGVEALRFLAWMRRTPLFRECARVLVRGENLATLRLGEPTRMVLQRDAARLSLEVPDKQVALVVDEHTTCEHMTALLAAGAPLSWRVRTFPTEAAARDWLVERVDAARETDVTNSQRREVLRLRV
ncbi:MAG: hypothetical protein ACOCZK_02680 [Planctomycetota bacterium]